MTSVSFNSFGNSALIKQLLNIVFNVSEQMVLVDFRSFGGIPFDVRDSCPGRNYSQVVVWGAKVLSLCFLFSLIKSK